MSPDYWQDNENVYPRKTNYSSDRLGPSEELAVDLATLKHAIENGLDPNVLWTEEELTAPMVQGGCVAPSLAADDETWPHWNTPIHRAVWLRDFEGAEILIQHGADINLFNSMGQTALHEAVWHNCLEAVDFVLKNGADPNKKTVSSKIRYKQRDMDLESEGDFLPLHLAMLRGWNTEIITILLDAGTDLYATPFEGGWSFLDLAILACENPAVSMLLSRDSSLLGCLPVSVSEAASIDHTNAARDLLQIATSNRLVPPGNLHDVYCHVTAKIKPQEWSGSDTAIADDLVQAVFNELCDLAKMQIAPNDVGLCRQCSAFESAVSRSCGLGRNLRFRLYRTEQRLFCSVQNGCPLCGLVMDTLLAAGKNRRTIQSDGEINQSDEELAAVFLTLSLHGDPLMRRNTCKFTIECGDRTEKLELAYLDGSVMAGMQTPDNIALGTGSPKALLTAKEWLHTCRTSPEHSACQRLYRHREASVRLPSRLLYIAEGDCDPFLVEGKSVQASYCALSYCWGSSRSLVTTQANLAEHMKAIPMNTLASIMQDAILTATELGFQYIWIDALCIVQGDANDWNREASIMHDIYSNAELTISSLVAGDCMDSLFRPRAIWTSHPVPLRIWLPKQYRPDLKQGNVYYPAIFPGRPRDRFVLRAPIHSRGWTLQEQLLSTRMLYFGNGMLHWQCLCEYFVEANPTHCFLIASDFYDHSILDSASAKRAIRGNLGGEANYRKASPFEVWKSQLEIYSSRIITNPADRLPAFLAISKSIEKVLGNEFLGGVWNGDRLLESLSWKMKTIVSGEAKLPSWTWVSLEGEISFEYVERAGRGDRAKPIATVVSVDIKTNESQSRVSGSITLKGTLHKMRDFEARDENWSQWLYRLKVWLQLFGRKTQNSRWFWRYYRFRQKMGLRPKRPKRWARSKTCNQSFDQQDTVVENYYALDILSYDRGPKPKGYGLPTWPSGRPPSIIRLLLQPVITNDLTTFRRIGIGMYNKDEDEEDVNSDPEASSAEGVYGRHIFNEYKNDTWPRRLQDETYFNRVVKII